MASELKSDEEGMAEILQTNETVIRVMDRYKGVFGEPPPSTASTSSSSSATSTTATAATGGGATTTTTSSSGATASGSDTATGGGASSKQDDVLIDLLDLDLGPSPSGGNLSSGSGGSIGAGGSGSGTNLGSLLDDFGSLSMLTLFSCQLCMHCSTSVIYMLTHSFSLPPLSLSLSLSPHATDLPPVASTAQSTVRCTFTPMYMYCTCSYT